MKQYFIKLFKQSVLCFILFLVFSCGLKSIPSEYTFIKNGFEKVELDNLGNGKVLIYNGADILHKIDNTSRINIWINDKPLGQLKASEYVIIDLKKDTYKFKVQHLDVVNMRSMDEVEIDEKTKVIKIKPNVTSNKLRVTNELPKNFDKFKYALKR
ncbi:hypothetical protein [Flavobacterium piscisymbiosum]|uniref:DUF2846 domain-containing protein n=1 Tax=Flavobacterium piscisymbiosum TaxID=2893753 RepID=A0ABS8MBC9_9FLAO|nr:hypothetical protein [Flavobacterium sp. F-30]MCC9062628.1 hypothetical protein [Flavobacterium sp. F-30]